MIEMEKIWVNISDVLFFQEGPGVRNTQYTTSGVKLLNVANLVDGKVDLSTSDRYISEGEAYGKYSHFLCDVGEFIVASSGIKVEYIDKKMGFIEESMLPLCMNTSTIRFKVLDEKQLRIRYFMYYLKSQHFKGQLAREITGSAQLNYGPSHLKKMVMPLVDISIQDEIVRQMDKVQKIIDMRQMELSHLDDLIKARFVEMFGHPDLNEKGWKMNTFGDICTVRQGLQIPISKRLTEYEEDCYEYITVQYLHGGKEREYIKSPKPTVICTKDDILMRRTGNTGMVITNVDGVFHNNFFLIDFDREKYDKDFLVQYLNLDLIQADILRRAGTSTIPDLNHGEFYKIRVFEPPFDLQRQFNDFKRQVDKSKFININIIPEGGFYNGDKFYIS